MQDDVIRARHAQKITATLFLAQSVGSAGFIAASTINPIVGEQLSRQPALAGLPSAVYLLGSALAAFAWGYAMDAWGRRGGLTLGLILGIIGAAIAGGAVIANTFPGFLAGMVLMGAANAALQLGRFAAAEVHLPADRGKAISNVVLGGTVGAVLGPLMVGPMGDVAQSVGADKLSGPYGASLVLFAFGAMAIFAFLRPEPRDLGRALERLYPPATTRARAARSLGEIVRVPGVFVAMIAMAGGQLAMVMLMVITSLHMKNHQHALGDIALVISSHTFGMFAFSIVSGRLADRWGRAPVIALGSLALILACLAAPLSPDVFPISVALFLLGLGWNFAFVGGSTLLADQLSPDERARTQGFNDLMIGLVSALGSLSSGLVFAALDYAAIGMIGAIVSFVPLAFAVWWRAQPLANSLAKQKPKTES
ncbi:MAG: MFS transporter [Chloroflexi bacterium]|nr:MFS transporter [Chloroflexota bacterium]